MGYLLRRQYNLTTLVIGFELTARQSLVRCTLEHDQHGERARALDYTLDPAELGIPDRLDRARACSRATRSPCLAMCSTALRAELDARLLPGEAVWLYLKSPVGYLALAPWEQILFPALARPVLRLPDFLVDPAQPAGEINIVLCSSQPISEEAFASSEYMARMTRLVLDQATRRTTVHLFTDAGLMADLTHQLGELRRLRQPRDTPQPAGG